MLGPKHVHYSEVLNHATSRPRGRCTPSSNPPPFGGRRNSGQPTSSSYVQHKMLQGVADFVDTFTGKNSSSTSKHQKWGFSPRSSSFLFSAILVAIIRPEYAKKWPTMRPNYVKRAYNERWCMRKRKPNYAGGTPKEARLCHGNGIITTWYIVWKQYCTIWGAVDSRGWLDGERWFSWQETTAAVENWWRGGGVEQALCHVFIYTAVLLTPPNIVPIDQTLDSLLQIRRLGGDFGTKIT